MDRLRTGGLQQHGGLLQYLCIACAQADARAGAGEGVGDGQADAAAAAGDQHAGTGEGGNGHWLHLQGRLRGLSDAVGVHSQTRGGAPCSG